MRTNSPASVFLAVLVLIAAGAAACGTGNPSLTPNQSPRPTPIAVPGQTPIASAPGDGASATLTVAGFEEADGPGGSVSNALANAGILGRQLVNGFLLTEVDGTVWLCDALLTSTPPDCAEPRVRVVNLPPETPTDASGDGHHEVSGVRWQDHVQLYGDVRLPGSEAAPSAVPTPIALAPTPPAEPTEFVPPTPLCPAPPNAVQAPTVTVSVAGSTILATNGSSGFLTCSTAANSDAAPEDPRVGVVAHQGDLMTMTLSPGWRVLRWHGPDLVSGGEGSNVSPAVDTPERPGHIDVPVPVNSGDAIAGYHLWLASVDGRAVGELDILVRVSVR